MYVHNSARLVYLAHPRTASHATMAGLLDIGFVKEGDNHHMRLEESDIVTQENRHEWTVFTTVRNHYDALVSWCIAKDHFAEIAGPVPWKLKPFKASLAANSWIAENELWHPHKCEADVILRYESLEDDLRDVLGVRLCLPRKNVSKERGGRFYREFYSDEVRKYVAERFGDEMKHFDYIW